MYNLPKLEKKIPQDEEKLIFLPWRQNLIVLRPYWKYLGYFILLLKLLLLLF